MGTRFQSLYRGNVLATIVLVAWMGCSSSDSTTTNYDTPETFFSTMTQMTVEVAYEPSAEPYTGNGPGGTPLWKFVQDNMAALFDGRATEPTISVPTTLEQMQAIPDQTQSSFSSAEILALSSQYRQGRSSATESNFFILFLDGYFEEDDGSENRSVIGVSINGTTVLAMFKPVITATSSGVLAVVPKFVELTTVVHELGHALGLVNNGIIQHEQHHDSEHGAHCDNDQCVMYYLNEGAGDLKTFVQQYILTGGNTIVFDNKCLSDARNYLARRRR